MKTLYRSKFFLILLIAALIGSGCKKDIVTDMPIKAGSISADAAYSIAVATGEEGGGVTETYSDLLNVLSLGTISPTMTISNGDFETVRSGKSIYGSSSGWWTVSITRTHSGRVTSFEKRTYQYRFWKDNMRYQQYFVSNGDTAVMMEFKIVSGSGYFKNPTITHRLTRLSGTFLVTDINKETVTITLQDDYVRSSVDSIVTKQVVRVLTHTVSIYNGNTQVQALRFQPISMKPIANWRNDLHTSINGTMYGHISATITGSNEDYYKERTVDQDFAVSFTTGNGEGSIRLGLNGIYGRFRFNLETDDGN